MARVEFRVGDKVTFNHAGGELNAEVVGLSDEHPDKMEVIIQGWLGRHWYPKSSFELRARVSK